MDPVQFFSASRLLVVAGKGGVGKTTVTAVIARAAARSGLRVLVIDVEGRPGLAGLLGGDDDDVFTYAGVTLPDEPVRASATDGHSGSRSTPDDPGDLPPTGGSPHSAAPHEGSIEGRLISSGEALRDYLVTHGLGLISGRLVSSGVLDVVSTAAPGIEDILVLGKVKQLERSGEYDLIVLDGPAAGHAITFLQSARGLIDSVRAGPIQTQATEITDLLADPERCQVILVTLPEPTPVNEVVETAYALEDRIGVALAPIVVNAVYPPRELPPARRAVAPADPETAALHAAAEFRRVRCAAQAEQIAGLAERLPLPQIALPFRFTAGLDRADIDVLADHFLDQIGQLP